MKEIARWSRDEVAALLRAWREGLEHQPNPLRRGKLNGFVSERFHALRACYEPFRTACSIVYKKKYWKSMVQFICEYQEQSGDWFALSPAERKRCFGELKTTSYKFTDLEQDTAFEIAQLITLEDGTPGLADLVYMHSSLDYDHDQQQQPPLRHYDSSASDGGGAWGSSPRDAAASAMELDEHDDPRRRYPLATPHLPYMASPEKRGYRYGDYHDDASATSSGEGDDDDDDDGDESSELQYQQPSAASTPRSAMPSPLEFGDHPLLPASVSRYHQQREDVDDALSPSPPPLLPLPPQYSTIAPTDLLSIVRRLEAQAQQLKDMVQQERAERRRARAQQEAQQQAWEAEQAQHKKTLEALRGCQLKSQASDAAKQAQHDEWAKVLQQLQLDRAERVQAQSAQSADESERQKLLEEIVQSQMERQRMKDAWAAEQQQRAALLDQIRQERLARNKDNSHWRVLLAQVKSERAVSDAKALSARHSGAEVAAVREERAGEQLQPGSPEPASAGDNTAPPATLAPADPVAGPEAATSNSSKQETRANPSVRLPTKRSRPAVGASEDESRARGHRVRRV